MVRGKKKARPGRSGPAAATLLVELGTEELPPRALRRLGEQFGVLVQEELARRELLVDPEVCAETFATPRRLAVKVPGVRRRQPDREVVRRGPALAAAFDADGRPTKAAEGFARSCGVGVEQLERLENDKGAWLIQRRREPGRPARFLVPEALGEALKRLPIPKRMRWGEGEAEFVRPVHWLVLLHGADLVPAEILSVRAGRATRGHRFHHPRPIALRNADQYPGPLEQRGFVIADFDRRRARIRARVDALARARGGRALYDDALLDEVTALVEWPQPVAGGFDPGFLEVPPEPLVSAMRDHQKYFAVADARGRLLPHFVAVANIKSPRPSRIRAGNERVLRARFADARFFWDTDRKTPLAERVEGLKDVVFHLKLGSLYDKTLRVRALAAQVAGAIHAERALAERAAWLAKADLMTGMVGEFPELQGIMGRYYARHDGEDPQVAEAIAEHYLPRHAGDALPQTGVGQALAVADRLDTLAGIFGAGEAPSGDKDPFALRRAALGVLRVLIERRLDLDLRRLLDAAVAGYELAFEPGGVADQVFDFMLERLRAYYMDAGVALDVFEAVRVRRPVRPLDFHRRVQAVSGFLKRPEAASLTAANKRIRNLLRQAGGAPAGSGEDSARYREAAERELAQRVAALEGELAGAFEAGDYDRALAALAGLREPVDRFFDQVMVMVEDEALRGARLRLLKRLNDLFLRVADLSRLPG